jgi:hypothetical protein
VNTPYRLKTLDRTPLLTGEQVRCLQAIAKVGDAEVPVEGIADGLGLAQRDGDPWLEHDTDPNHMRVTPEGTKVDYVQFDLGGPVALDLMEVWNYNEQDRTQWGLADASLAVWTEAGGWQKVKDHVSFDQAEGTSDYDEPTVVQLGAVQAAKVRLENLVGFPGSNRVGLAEVRFFGVRPAKAIKPEPADGGSMRDQPSPRLAWTPGVGINRQQIYIGLEANEPTLIGEVAADVTQVRLSSLACDADYSWRIDAVRSDGSVVPGEAWSFRTQGLVAWWKLDETSGSLAADASGNGLDAQVCGGDPNWQPGAGRIGGALALDGVDDHVQLPVAVGSGGGALTVALWARPTGVGSWARFVEFGNGPFTDNIQFGRVETSADLALIVYGEGRDSTRITAASAIDLDTWQFFAATVDAAGQARIIKDGKVIASGTLAPIRDVTRIHNYVGRTNYDWDAFYKGLIDDVRVYARALSESEAQALYEGRPIERQVEAVTLPRILPAARATEMAAEVEAQPIGATAGQPVPAQAVTQRVAMGPMLLIGVVALAGILGIVLVSGRKRI